MPQAALRQDGHWGTSPHTFTVNLLDNATYWVNVTLGDASYGHYQMQVQANGTTVISSASTAPGEFYQTGFFVTLPTGQTTLALQFSGLSVNHDWVVNGLEIRPGGVGTVAFTPLSSVSADGYTVDTVSGTATGVADGMLLTLATTLGTITSDASAAYAGAQAVVTGGTFSFQLRRPSGAGTPTITAMAVDGSAHGSGTPVTYTAGALRFDFNSGASATAAGYVGLGGDNVYNAARGYGWIAPANVFDNNGSDPLLSDGHWSQDDTFLVDVPNGTYDVTLTLGDDYATRPQLNVYAEGALVTSSLVTPQGQRTVYSVPSVAVSDGQLAVRIASPVYPFTLNALEVRLSTAVGTIGLAGAASAPADGSTVTAYTGSGAPANGLVTLTATAGTLVTAGGAPLVDASPLYAGVQVQADGSGGFTFGLRSPAAGASVTLTAAAVTGAARDADAWP